MAISVGSIVTLRMGGPVRSTNPGGEGAKRMKVLSIAGDVATCKWYTPQNIGQMAEFPVADLVPVPSRG